MLVYLRLWTRQLEAMRLRGKNALVTGGGSGIGEAAALVFAREGASVTVSDFDSTRGANVVEKINSDGGKGLFVETDVSDAAQVSRAVQKASEAFGGIDVLLNAAGALFYGTILETDDAAWNRILSVNLTGTFLFCRAVLPYMLQKGGGSIINVSSTTGAHDACAHAVAYVASKGGVAAFTRAMAIDHAKQGIRVNALCPGPTDTPMLRKALTPDELLAFAQTLPIGRLGLPRELAEAVLFLASDESSFMTGSMLTVDGGQTAQV